MRKKDAEREKKKEEEKYRVDNMPSNIDRGHAVNMTESKRTLADVQIYSLRVSNSRVRAHQLLFFFFRTRRCF